MAAAAGVSYQTVSRVLNESPRVSAETRARVVEAMGRLGYRPSRAARALGLGRARAVTVVTSNTTLYGYASVLQGIEGEAREQGFSVGVRVIESGRQADVRQAVEYASDPTAGGVVVVAFDAEGMAALRLLPADVPAVAAVEPGAVVESERTVICLDEGPAAADATRHLLGLGHRTVHHVAIPSESGTRGREAGWRQALDEAGAPVPEVVPAGWDTRSAYEAGRTLAGDAEVTAILCGNDDTALAVRRALYDAGRDVPGDVSVVGFDDVPGSAYWTPALTTVRIDFAALGRACLAALAAEMDGLAGPSATLPVPHLVLRESTAPPGRQ
ncbi:LacI family DNA-binding transcriptional regulator [Actinocorallia aurea]